MCAVAMCGGSWTTMLSTFRCCLQQGLLLPCSCGWHLACWRVFQLLHQLASVGLTV